MTNWLADSTTRVEKLNFVLVGIFLHIVSHKFLLWKSARCLPLRLLAYSVNGFESMKKKILVLKSLLFSSLS